MGFMTVLNINEAILLAGVSYLGRLLLSKYYVLGHELMR